MHPIVNGVDANYFDDMSKEVRYPHKLLIQLDEELNEAVRAYRFKHRYDKLAEAVRDLLRAGLEKDKGK